CRKHSRKHILYEIRCLRFRNAPATKPAIHKWVEQSHKPIPCQLCAFLRRPQKACRNGTRRNGVVVSAHCPCPEISSAIGSQKLLAFVILRDVLNIPRSVCSTPHL